MSAAKIRGGRVRLTTPPSPLDLRRGRGWDGELGGVLSLTGGGEWVTWVGFLAFGLVVLGVLSGAIFFISQRRLSPQTRRSVFRRGVRVLRHGLFAGTRVCHLRGGVVRGQATGS